METRLLGKAVPTRYVARNGDQNPLRKGKLQAPNGNFFRRGAARHSRGAIAWCTALLIDADDSGPAARRR